MAIAPIGCRMGKHSQNLWNQETYLRGRRHSFAKRLKASARRRRVVSVCRFRGHTKAMENSKNRGRGSQPFLERRHT